MLVTKKQMIIGSAVAVAGGIVYMLSVSRAQANEVEQIKKAINTGKGATGTAQDLAQANAFDPNYWKKISKQRKVVLLTPESAKKFSNVLFAAPGIWNDDEDAVYTTFNKLRSKVQISQVADKFSDDHNKILYDFLDDFLDAEEMEKVSKIIRSKDNY